MTQAPGGPGRTTSVGKRPRRSEMGWSNDISWQTIMQAAFALPLVAVAVTRRPNAMLVVAFQIAILVFVFASALRYRSYGVRLRRQIRDLDGLGSRAP